LWRRRCSIWLHCNRKTERSGCVMGRQCRVVSSGGGFAPTPPGFGAVVPLPMRGLYPRVIKKGCRSIPLNRSRPLSSPSNIRIRLLLAVVESRLSCHRIEFCSHQQDLSLRTRRRSDPHRQSVIPRLYR